MDASTELQNIVGQWFAAREGELPALVMLPEISSAGEPFFREHLDDLPKELRLVGVPAEFVRLGNHVVRSEYSASVVALDFALSLGAAMTWDLAKAAANTIVLHAKNYLGGDEKSEISVRLTRISSKDGAIAEELSIVGCADEAMIERLVRAFGPSKTEQPIGDG